MLQSLYSCNYSLAKLSCKESREPEGAKAGSFGLLREHAYFWCRYAVCAEPSGGLSPEQVTAAALLRNPPSYRAEDQAAAQRNVNIAQLVRGGWPRVRTHIPLDVASRKTLRPWRMMAILHKTGK